MMVNFVLCEFHLNFLKDNLWKHLVKTEYELDVKWHCGITNFLICDNGVVLHGTMSFFYSSFKDACGTGNKSKNRQVRLHETKNCAQQRKQSTE